MASVDFSDTLVIGISATALFDLSEAESVFRTKFAEGRESAVREYRDYMLAREEDDLADGTGMALVKAPKKKSKRYKTRGNSLEIERKADEKYTEDNCELACYWCNNAKSDVFSPEEFTPIGKAIGDVIKSYS